MDSSGSISPNNWNTALQFVATVSSQFTIGPNNVQVAFVLFSDEATVKWDLRRHQDKAHLDYAIKSVRRIGSLTNLNDALYLTRTEVFAPGRGTRPRAKKVTIILTDGEDNVPLPGTPLTIQNATECKNAGIQLIAIGVSDQVTEQRLRQIVSNQHTDYYPVTDFSALQRSALAPLLLELCGISFTPAPVTSIKSCYTHSRRMLSKTLLCFFAT